MLDLTEAAEYGHDARARALPLSLSHTRDVRSTAAPASVPVSLYLASGVPGIVHARSGREGCDSEGCAGVQRVQEARGGLASMRRTRYVIAALC